MYAQIGHHYNNMKQWALAQKAFKKELEIYESPAAYISLALTFFQRKRYNLAVEPLEPCFMRFMLLIYLFIE